MILTPDILHAFPRPRGREGVVSTLIDALRSSGAVVLTASPAGPAAGLGRRSVVREALRRMTEADLILRLRADSETAWQCSLVRAARELVLPERFVRQADFPRLGVARAVRARVHPVIWIDGAAAPERLAALQHLIPKARWLCTGGEQVLEGVNRPAIVTLERLPPEELEGLLCSPLPPTAPLCHEVESAGEIAACAGLPAAAVLFAAARRAHSGGEWPAEESLPCHEESVLWQGARRLWRRLGRGPIAHGLALAATLDAEQIPLSCLNRICQREEATGHDPAAGASLLATLTEWRLVEQGQTAGMFSLPPSIHQALRGTLPVDLREWALAAWGRSLDIWTELELPPENRALHVEALAEGLATANVHPSTALDAAKLARDMCLAVGAVQRAIEWGRRIVAASMASSDTTPEELAAAWVRLAETQRGSRQLQAARQSSRAAEDVLGALPQAPLSQLVQVKCDIVEADLEEGRPQRAWRRMQQIRDLVSQAVAPLDDLTAARCDFLRAACLMAGKRPDLAEPLLRDVLETREKLTSVDDVEVLRIRSLLARVLFQQRKFAQAEQLLLEDLQVRRESPCVAPAELIVAANFLAEVYFVQGRYAAAEPLFDEVLTLRRETLGERDRLVGETAQRLAMLRSSRGDHAGADPLFRLALSIAEDLYGSDHPSLAAILNPLAQMLFDQGRYDQARRLLERALAIQQRSLRPRDPQILETRNNLAAVLVARGEFEPAARLYETNLAVMEPGDHPLKATTLNNLGDVARSLGRYEAAEQHLLAALHMRQRLHHAEHPVVGQSWNNLGYLYLLRGQTSEAQAAVERALAIRRQSLAPSHPHIANSLTTLGRILHRSGELPSALDALVQAAEAYRASFGERHPQYAASLTLVGRLEVALGRRAKAELHLLRARVVLEETLGTNHRWFAELLVGLAELSEAEGRPADAFPLYERALAILRQTMALDRYELVEILLGLGRNLLQRELPAPALERLEEAERLLSTIPAGYRGLRVEVWQHLAGAALHVGRAAEAEVAARKALESLAPADASEPAAGGEQTVTNPAAGDLERRQVDLRLIQAEAAVRLGRADEALALFRRLSEDVQRRAGPQSAELVPVLSRLAATLALRGAFAEAEGHVRRCVRIAEQTQGRQHPETARHLDHLASLLAQQGRTSESEELFREVLDIYEATYGPGHAAVADVLQKYATLLHRLSRETEAFQFEDRARAIEGRSLHVLEDIL